LPVFSSLPYIILTEHQLSAEFRPDEIIKCGLDFHTISGTVTTLPQRGYRGQRYRGGLALLTRNSMRFSTTLHSLSGAVNTILGDNCTSLNSESRGNVHGSATSSSLHQTVTWSLLSPFYNDTIHLTGVYIFFPNEGNFEEFFDTLTAHSNHPSHKPHIYTGDFNAYTAEEIESHITPLDPHTLFRRMGDTSPAHSPASPLTTATARAADYRGRLLLNMLNSIEFIITNCRFPPPPPNHRPYTFFRKPNTYSILDYYLIAKRHAPLIGTCQVLQNVLPVSVTDHMPIHLHLDLPTSSNPVPPLPLQTSPARTLYHSKRLKDPQTEDTFTSALAKKVAKITPTFQVSRLTAQLHSSKVSPQSFADTANAAITEILQHAAFVVLGKVDPPTHKNEANKSAAQHNANHHSSQKPQEAHLQHTIQHHRNAIHTLQQDLSLDDPDTLTFHRDKLNQAHFSLDKLRNLKRQGKLLSTITQDAANDVGPADHQHNSMWDRDYLEKYKNNHTTSSLPQKTRCNASPDKRI